MPAKTFLAIVLLFLLSGFVVSASAAVETAAKQPKSYSISSPEGQALHQQMMQMQQMQMMQQRQEGGVQNLRLVGLQSELKGIDASLMDAKTSKKQKKVLKSRRAKLELEIKELQKNQKMKD